VRASVQTQAQPRNEKRLKTVPFGIHDDSACHFALRLKLGIGGDLGLAEAQVLDLENSNFCIELLDADAERQAESEERISTSNRR
jgi:hypothetical protein